MTHLIVHYDQLDSAQAAKTRQLLGAASGQVAAVATFGDDVAYRLTPTDRFTALRALIPPAATIYLSREDPTGAYGGMLGRVLRENPIYTRVRVDFGQEYAGSPDPAARYDYAILYRQGRPRRGRLRGGHCHLGGRCRARLRSRGAVVRRPLEEQVERGGAE